MVLGKKMSVLFDVLGKLCAVLTVALYAFLFVNANFKWVDPASEIVGILEIVRTYAALVVVIIVGLEFAVKRNIVIFILFCLLAAITVVFSFFPESVPAFLQGA